MLVNCSAAVSWWPVTPEIFPSGELVQEKLGVQQVEDELALAVRQVILLEDRFDLLARNVLVEQAALVEQVGARLGIQDVEDGSVEADLAPAVQDPVGHDPACRIAEHGLRVPVADEMSGRN